MKITQKTERLFLLHIKKMWAGSEICTFTENLYPVDILPQIQRPDFTGGYEQVERLHPLRARKPLQEVCFHPGVRWSSNLVKRVQQLFVTINRKQLRDPSVCLYRKEREVMETSYNLVYLTFASSSFFFIILVYWTCHGEGGKSQWKMTFLTLPLTAFAIGWQILIQMPKEQERSHKRKEIRLLFGDSFYVTSWSGSELVLKPLVPERLRSALIGNTMQK